VPVFGGLWGFWGVFFAIPLATLVKVLLTTWPRRPLSPEQASA
jgi:putative permease